MQRYATPGIVAAQPVRESRARALAAATLSIVSVAGLAAAVIGTSLARGKLALPATYDDVSYFLDAATRLRLLREAGLVAFFTDYAVNPPHAPLWTLLCMLGFALFGIAPASASIAAAALLLVPLAMLHWAARGLPFHLAALLSLALLGMPLATIIILEFRPDAACALATALGTLLIILRPWPLPRGEAMLAGAFFGAALLLKPSVFHVTTLLFGAALGLGALNAVLWERVRIGSALVSMVLVVAVGVLVALPHYAFGFGNTLRYIYTNIFGDHASLWKVSGSFGKHALYYLSGGGARFAIGSWLFPAALMGAAVVWHMLAARDYVLARRTGCVFLLTAFCYLVVSLPPTKSPFIGISFAAYVSCGTALAAIYLLKHLQVPRPAIALAICIALLTFSAGTYRVPQTFERRYLTSEQLVESRNSMLAQAVTAVDRNELDRVTVLQSSVSWFTNLATLGFVLAQGDRRLPNLIDLHRETSVAAFRTAVEKADVVIALSPQDADAFVWLPSAGLRAQHLEILQDDARFQLKRTIPDPVFGGAVHIFERKPAP